MTGGAGLGSPRRRTAAQRLRRRLSLSSRKARCPVCRRVLLPGETAVIVLGTPVHARCHARGA